MPWQPPASDADPNWRPPEAKPDFGLTGASISPAPVFDQPVGSSTEAGRAILRALLGSVGLHTNPVDVPTPSPAQLTDLIPGVLGGAGAIATGGSPAGAALGSGAGEVIRQGIRQEVGQAPATGVAQRMLGLDPRGRLAMLTGIGAEAAGGGLTQGAFNKAAALAPKVENVGLKVYASTLNPNEAAAADIMDKLRPIQGDLPVGTAGRLYRTAEGKAAQAGENVGRVYTTDQPASFEPVKNALAEARDKYVRTPGQFVEEYDPELDDVVKRWIAPDLKDPQMWKAFNARREAMQKAQFTREEADQPVTLTDLFEGRRTADDMALRARKTLFTPGGQKLTLETPRSQALVTERNAFADQMHDLTRDPETGVSAGEEADKLFGAWKTLQSGSSKAGRFPGVWARPSAENILLKMVTGNYPMLRTPVAQSLYAFAQALKSGNTAVANQALRGVFNLPYSNDDTSQTPSAP